MSLQVFLKIMFGAEFLLTNVTCEPSAFVVWLQQMCHQSVAIHKLFWTVCTCERLCTSVNTYMTLHICDCRKLLSTIRTWMWSYIAVYISFMCTQVAGMAETFVTQWTLVWLWLISTVNSAVHSKVPSTCKSFSANRTLKRFLSRMHSSVYC